MNFRLGSWPFTALKGLPGQFHDEAIGRNVPFLGFDFEAFPLFGGVRRQSLSDR